MMLTRLLACGLFIVAGVFCSTGSSIAQLPDDTTTPNITLKVEDVPLLDVLYMIAQQNNLNLVTSGDVTGEVSLHLERVDITTALDAILSANGYNYSLRNGVIVVKSQAMLLLGELESRVVTLRWADPGTVKKALEPRVSDKGSVVILDRQTEDRERSSYKPNRLMITDYPAVLEELLKLIAEVDIREQVVLIEAKIIETKRDNNSNLGFLWPTQVGTSWPASGSAGGGTSSGTEGTSSAIELDPNTGDWTWGTLSVNQLNLVLNLLEQDNNSRLVSDPRVSTLENHRAEIRIETVIPIQTINRFTEGAATSDIVTFQDEEVGIVLNVTPRINEPGSITLEVYPRVEEIIGFSGPPNNQKPITSERSVQTTITVKEGETAAIGGLLKEDEITKVNRVPVLGHIPILGGLLFTNKSVEKSTTDLIILITPTIIR